TVKCSSSAQGCVIIGSRGHVLETTDPGRINKFPDLTIDMYQFIHWVASRAGYVINHRTWLTSKSMQQRRLTDIRAPYDCHTARPLCRQYIFIGGFFR